MSVTTGTFPGVRIVDMPDLGAVNDASSVVGERAGSGRFSAPAFRSYVSSYLGTNVRDYGARGDGVSDDTAAIQAAINAVRAARGTVDFNAGVYMTSATLELPTWVILRGKGVGITTIRAMGGNFDMLQTTAFSSLTGTGSNAGTYQNGVFGMTLDGNKAAGRTSGRCLAMYGYDYRIEDVECCNAPGVGFYSEWGFTSEVPVPAGGNSMEAHIYRLKTFNNGGDGWVFLGPHDSIIVDGTSFLNGGRGLWIGGTTDVNSGGCQLTNFHGYGNQAVGIQVDVPIWANTVQGENNRSTGGIAVTHGGSITGSNIIAYENTGFGVQFAGDNSLVSGMFIYDNSADGLDISGWRNLLSTISSSDNGGSGVVLGPSSSQTGIYGLVAASNASLGLSIGSGDCQIAGLLCLFNTGGGVGVANGLGAIRLDGEINNNGSSGVQLAFNTLVGGNVFDLFIFTEAGQTAWTGTPGPDSFMRIATTGASIMPLNVVPRDTLAAGSVGEFITSSVAEGSALSATSGAPLNVLAIVLQPGDWDVFGNVGFTFSTEGAGASAWIGTASAAQPVNGSLGFAAFGAILGTDALIATGTARISLTVATTVYLGATSGFGSGTSSVFGTIGARRAC